MTKTIESYSAVLLPALLFPQSPEHLTGFAEFRLWCPSMLVSSPVFTDDLKWENAPGRNLVRICNYVYRDGIFGDMFEKLAKAPKETYNVTLALTAKNSGGKVGKAVKNLASKSSGKNAKSKAGITLVNYKNTHHQP